jgi:D-amino-acid dehydrogenase
VRIIVIGGGAVGLCVAEALVSRGVEVTVLERDRCGSGASAGNAGWITPSLSIPVPGPGVIAESLRWLVNPSGPLWIRPTLSPALLDWIARFVLSCRRPVYAHGLRALQQAAALAGPAYDRLAQRGVELELHDDPLLYPAFEPRELDVLERVSAALERAGAAQPLERLTAAEVTAHEPALHAGVVGGMLARGERRVRPETLTGGLRRRLVAAGAEVHEDTPVTGLVRDGSRWLAQTRIGSVAGDAVVLSNGVACARLLARLGVHLPIAAAKGYSRTYPPDASGPRGALYLEGPKVAISAFAGGIRVSGTLELGARSLAFSARRLTAIAAAAQRAMPRWRPAGAPDDWAGMRSLSPDGLPYVGPVPGLDGLHVATAHATLGITLAPATGELVADALAGRTSGAPFPAFDPARCARRVPFPIRLALHNHLDRATRAPLSPR